MTEAHTVDQPSESIQPDKQTLILEGSVTAFFAFDVGYEVSLDKLNTLTSSVPLQPLSPKKRTPTSIQYARPPRVMNLGMHEIASAYFNFA